MPFPLLHAKLNLAHFAWRRLVTQTWYRLFFRKVGRKTTLYHPGLLAHPECISIGNRSLIRHGCRLEVVRTAGVEPSLIIGDNVNIEQNVHIICHDRVHIGDNVSITGHCAIVDVTHPLSAFAEERKIGDAIQAGGGYIEIGDGSFLGFGTTVMPNVRIGRQCVIGAGSVVNCDIPDHSVAAGVPARVLRQISLVAEQKKESITE